MSTTRLSPQHQDGVMSEPIAERLKKRRSLWRVIVVIVILLMPIWYVITWLMVGIAFNRGYIPATYAAQVALPFRPLMAYAESDFYGSDAMQRLYCKANWSEVSRIFSNNDDIASDTYSIQCGPFSPFIKVSVYRALVNEYGDQDDKLGLESTTEQKWPFDQAKNVAAITTRQVVEEGKPILMVIHYSDDHSWAFLCNTTGEQADGRVIGMGEALQIDPTLRTIAHLPPGWIAVRTAIGEKWMLERSTEH